MRQLNTNVVLSALLATLAAAQGSTVNLFLPSAYDPSVEFAASVIDACSDQTVYAMQCTAGKFASTITCDSNGPTFTVTEGPSTYIATTHSSYTSALMTYTEACSLSGTTAASCEATLAISSNAKTTSTTSSVLYSGPTVSEFYIYQVPITAGVDKLNAKSGTCSSDARLASTVAMGSLMGAFLLTTVLIL